MIWLYREATIYIIPGKSNHKIAQQPSTTIMSIPGNMFSKCFYLWRFRQVQSLNYSSEEEDWFLCYYAESRRTFSRLFKIIFRAKGKKFTLISLIDSDLLVSLSNLAYFQSRSLEICQTQQTILNWIAICTKKVRSLKYFLKHNIHISEAKVP